MGYTRKVLLGLLVMFTAVALADAPASAQPKPNIVIIWGDDIGQSNISAYSRGVMGYQTPNIDRVAREGMMFTDYYAEASCTAGRAAFITGERWIPTQPRVLATVVFTDLVDSTALRRGHGRRRMECAARTARRHHQTPTRPLRR